MRESLTVLAMLLIVVLTTALVGPYFVDWNAHRGQIETRLSTLLGAHVAIAGPIDVKLLPRPIFRLQQVTVTGQSPRQGRVAAQRLDLELALSALLRGEVNFVDADITGPELTLSVAADRSVTLPDFGNNPDRVRLNHVALHDGTVTLLGQDGRPVFQATGLSGDGSAESLAGPFRFSGHVDTPRGPLGLQVATGAYENRRMRLKATVDRLPGIPKSELEGTLVSAASPTGSALTFDGTVAALGALPIEASGRFVPWTFASKLHAGAGAIEGTDIELRAGADGRALVANGTAHVDLGADPAATLTLHTRQIDVTRLVVIPGQNGESGTTDPASPPSRTIADEIAALQTLAQNADAFAALPLPLSVDFGIDTVALGAETFGNLAGAVRLAAGVPVTGSVQIAAADGSRLRLDGTFEPGPAAVFKGRAEAQTRDLQRFASGLASDLPEAGDWLKRTIPVSAFGFAGTVDLSAVGFAAHDTTVSLDRSTFAGTVTLTRAVGSDPARLFADLTSDALDLEALPGWRSAAETAAGLDLALSVSARAIRLARSDTGDVDAGRITLQLNKSGSAVRLDRLSLADLGGATSEITGRSDGKTAHVEGRFDARRLRDLLNLVQRLAPGRASDELLARADTLSPALFGVAADATFDPDGNLVPAGFSVDGTAAGTRVALHLRPDAGPTPADDPLSRFRPERPPFAVSLVLDAPESGALLRQLGLPTLPTTAIGHGRIEAAARLSPTGTLDGTATGTFADTVLTLRGRGAQLTDISGHLGLRAGNLAPLLRAVTVASPDTSAVWPADADADIRWFDGRLTLKTLAGQLAGTRFGGELTLVPPAAPTAEDLIASVAGRDTSHDAPVLTGALSVERLPVPLLAGLALGPLPAAKPGMQWPDARFAAVPLRLPRSEVSVKATSLPLTDSVVARNATLTLRLAPGVVTMSDLAAQLGDGRIGANLTLRRDGAGASLAGHLEWSGLPLATPALGGRAGGALDVAGSGTSLAALVASLAGNGTVSLDDARLPRFDVGAIGRTIALADAANGVIDDSEINGDVAHELDKGASPLGAVSAPATLAAGVLRAEPVRVDGPALRTDAVASLDLRNFAVSVKSTAVLKQPPKDWTGNPPQLAVTWKGPFAAPAREIDAAALVNGLAARAIAREQARIEAFQDDIRERAFFSRKLKAIEAEQQAARDKARADQDAERLRAILSVKPVGGAAPNAEPVQKTPADPISRLLEGTKPAITLPAPPPVPSPVPRPAVVRPSAGSKPVDLRHGTPGDATAPAAALPDPGTAGRY